MFPLIAGKIYSKSIRQVNKNSKDEYKCDFDVASPTYQRPLHTTNRQVVCVLQNVCLKGKNMNFTTHPHTMPFQCVSGSLLSQSREKKTHFITIPSQEKEARLIDLQYMAAIETITHYVNLCSLANIVIEMLNSDNCFHVF